MRGPESLGAENAGCMTAFPYPNEPDDQELDPLFLESLVAEANRVLAGLNAVRCQVTENRSGDPEIRVSLKESCHPIGTISEERIHLLASKVQALRGLLGGL
ncbi:hypothetical protein SIID45300_00267 [Candidatus Magnetaquicoccaceae bacterium FCR-1]|uniref:Uncharacterized protein n=2 Tax=Candidatus Magnetaquiglobus chichijimensis TaxID=3141448 RepID=A0ABQ0C4Z9_9PROT